MPEMQIDNFDIVDLISLFLIKFELTKLTWGLIKLIEKKKLRLLRFYI